MQTSGVEPETPVGGAEQPAESVALHVQREIMI
jgi:hypothetical protein